VNLTLDVHPEGAGKIHISTITPDNYPWQGVYFNGVPIKIEAIANEGYNFLYWAPNGLLSDTLNPVFQDVLDTYEISFEAYFEEIATNVPAMKDPPGISIYPNPAKDILNIRNNKIQEDFHYEIIDVNGRSVLEGFLAGGNSAYTIPIISISPSVYLIRITDKEGKEFKSRFIKIENP
jgi:hypothetical protein